MNRRRVTGRGQKLLLVALSLVLVLGILPTAAFADLGEPQGVEQELAATEEGAVAALEAQDSEEGSLPEEDTQAFDDEQASDQAGAVAEAEAVIVSAPGTEEAAEAVLHEGAADDAEGTPGTHIAFLHTISGTLWVDSNSDGNFDADEARLANFPVALYKANNLETAIATTTTDASGSYTFAQLDMGSYVVAISAQNSEGYTYELPLQFSTGQDNRFRSWYTQQDGTVVAVTNAIVFNTNKSEFVSADGGIRVSESIASAAEGAPVEVTSTLHVMFTDNEDHPIVGLPVSLYACFRDEVSTPDGTSVEVGALWEKRGVTCDEDEGEKGTVSVTAGGQSGPNFMGGTSGNSLRFYVGLEATPDSLSAKILNYPKITYTVAGTTWVKPSGVNGRGDLQPIAGSAPNPISAVNDLIWKTGNLASDASIPGIRGFMITEPRTTGSKYEGGLTFTFGEPGDYLRVQLPSFRIGLLNTDHQYNLDAEDNNAYRPEDMSGETDYEWAIIPNQHFQSTASQTVTIGNTTYDYAGYKTSEDGELIPERMIRVERVTEAADYRRFYTRSVVVDFDVNGGTGNPAPLASKLSSDKLGQLPADPTAPAGKEFKGWFTAPEGGEQVTSESYARTLPTHEDNGNKATLYAQYGEPLSYTLYAHDFSVGDGRVPANVSDAFLIEQAEAYGICMEDNSKKEVVVINRGGFKAKTGSYHITFAIAERPSETKTITATVYPDIPLREPPTLIVPAYTKISLGASFDPMKGVSAYDDRMLNITKDIKVNNPVDVNKIDVYCVEYSVTAANGLTTTATQVVAVGPIDDSDPDYLLYATDFRIQSSNVDTANASSQIIHQSGARAWEKNTGDATSVVVHNAGGFCAEAGDYSITIAVAKKLSAQKRITARVWVVMPPPPGQDPNPTQPSPIYQRVYAPVLGGAAEDNEEPDVPPAPPAPVSSTVIPPAPTPTQLPNNTSWALLNLLMVILSAVLAVFQWLRFVSARKTKTTTPISLSSSSGMLAMPVFATLVALIAALIFLLTSNLSASMAVADGNTWLMILLAAFELIALALAWGLARKPKQA